MNLPLGIVPGSAPFIKFACLRYTQFGMRPLQSLKQWARRLKTETLVLYLAYRDPRTPWYARIVAGLVVAYALSPIDLIPDFIPVIGYLDDLIIVPLGIALSIRLIPAEVIALARDRARERGSKRLPVNRAAAVAIVVVWVAAASALFLVVFRLL